MAVATAFFVYLEFHRSRNEKITLIWSWYVSYVMWCYIWKLLLQFVLY